MIIGETVCARGEQATVVYSPWFQRLGNAATFILDVIASSGSNCTVTVLVQTKNSEDADPAPGGGGAAGGTFNQVGAGPEEHRNFNFKELLRFEFTVAASGSDIEWAHFRMLNPSWETN